MTNAAPYAADTKSKGWRFEIDLEQVMQSDTWALAQADIRPWLLMLWATAWQQQPCGSMPSDDALICARLGMPAKLFAKHKIVLLRGWWKADDGRLYHETLTKRVLDMVARKDAEKQRKADYRAKMEAERQAKNKESTNVPRDNIGTILGQQRDSGGCDATGTSTGTSTGLKKEEKSRAKRSDLKDFPLPDFVDRQSWALWMTTRKGNVMTAEQAQANVNKLMAWHERGLDANAALRDAASAGWAGLFEPRPPARASPHGNESRQQALERRNAQVAADFIKKLESEGEHASV